MRKIVAFIMCMALSTCVVCADAGVHLSDDTLTTPKSIYAANVDVMLKINGDKAIYKGTAGVEMQSTITKAVMTIKLVDARGKTVKNKAATVPIVNDSCSISDSCTLTVKGKYTAELTVKLYRGSKPVETVRRTSTVKEYK